MVDIVLERKVSFLGAWKTGKLTERLVYDISQHAERFQGSPTRLQLTRLGFKLHVKNGSGHVDTTDFIPVQNVYELSANKYRTTCLMCVMRDGTKGMSILAWTCKSDRDSFEIIKGFTFIKRSLGGEAEGYNVNLRKHQGNNWSLGRKDGYKVISRQSSEEKENPYSSIQMFGKFKGSNIMVKPKYEEVRTFANKEVQTVADDDTHSLSLSFGSSSLKDELTNLSEEVNSIKAMLQQVMGISVPSYYKTAIRQKGHGQELVFNPVQPNVTRGTFVSSKSEYANGTHTQNGENVNDICNPEYDVRSFGIQTGNKMLEEQKENEKHEKSKTVTSGPHANYLRANSNSSSRDARGVLGGESTVNSQSVYVQHRNPRTFEETTRGGKLISFITPPPERSSRSYERHHPRESDINVSLRNSLPLNPGPPIMHSTIPRTIENVYPSTRRYAKRSEGGRPRQVLGTDTFIRAQPDRKRSSSAHDTYRRPLDVATWQKYSTRRSSTENIRLE